LEPVHPDSLAQDYLAFATPGHLLDFDLSYPWAQGAAKRLLVSQAHDSKTSLDAGNKICLPPPWAGAAMRTLIETSKRWPHMATGELLPLLSDHPHLAAAAGTELPSIAGIAQVPVSFLIGLASSLLDRAQALIDGEKLADAQEAAQLALALYQRLTSPEGPDALRELNARGLAILSRIQNKAHDLEAAAETTASAVALYRDLAKKWRAIHQYDLAISLYLAAQAAQSDGRSREALPLVEECIAIYAEMEAAYRNGPYEQSFTHLMMEDLSSARELHAAVFANLR
jgi:hypothetical protein